MMFRNLIVAGLFSLSAISGADAAVIFDGGPFLPGDQAYGSWVNEASGQNFAVKVDFASAVAIDGFDIYINPYVAAGVGNPVELKIFAQNPQFASVTPGTYFSAIDSIQSFEINDVNRAHADFSPINLAAGEYWIGMSSANNLDLSWTSYRRPDPLGRPLADQLQLAGNAFAYNPGIYDLAFQIDGSLLSAVPEPETWVLFILGFGFVGAAMRTNAARMAREAC
jgi:hypothetical protein